MRTVLTHQNKDPTYPSDGDPHPTHPTVVIKHIKQKEKKKEKKEEGNEKQNSPKSFCKWGFHPLLFALFLILGPSHQIIFFSPLPLLSHLLLHCRNHDGEWVALSSSLSAPLFSFLRLPLLRNWGTMGTERKNPFIISLGCHPSSISVKENDEKKKKKTPQIEWTKKRWYSKQCILPPRNIWKGTWRSPLFWH